MGVSQSPTPSPSISSTPSISISRTPSITPSPIHNPFTSGLVACWDFEEASGTFYDSTENGHDLTTTNSITYRASGIVSYGFSQDANTDYVRGSSDGLRLSTFSISLWAKTSSANTQTLFDIKWYSPTRGIIMYIDSGGPLVISVYNNGVESYEYNGDWDLDDGNWHHIVWTFNGSNRESRTYVDGSLSSTIPKTLSFLPEYYSGSYVYLGNSVYETSGLIGTMDEVAMWDRVITSLEVAYLYNSGSGRPCYQPPSPSPTSTTTPSTSPTVTPSRTPSRTPTRSRRAS